MSNPYLPLILPEKGEDLLPGRQYALTPLARLVIAEVYGLRGIPTIVECIHAKRAATIIITRWICVETESMVERRVDLPAQAACFHVGGTKIKFELDLAELALRAPIYANSHKLPAFEEDWFKTRCLPPVHHKFRGCSLRWWSKGADTEQREFIPRRRKSTKEPLDLSIFD